MVVNKCSSSMPFLDQIARHLGRLRDRRGSVTLLVAVSMPAMVVLTGVGLEVSEWALATSRLQRAADAASVAGALNYGVSTSAQSAAGVAADVAEVNGAAGAASRSWNAGTKTLTDGNVTVVVGPGVVNSNNTSVTVTVSQTLSNSFTGILNITQPVLTASAAADATPSTATSQACILALDTAGGITLQDVVESGSASATLYNCSLRTNASVQLSGTATVTASNVYAVGNINMTGSSAITATTIAGTVSKSSAATITGTIVPPVTAETDPYASNSALTTAFTYLSGSGKTALSVGGTTTTTLSPGVWSSWSITNSAVVTLNPGLYVIQGTVAIQGSAKITGTGVTIVHGGNIALGGSAQVTLTAPGPSPTGGAVPGVLLASPNALTVSLTGGSSFPLTGVVYYPKGAVTLSGSTVPGGSSGCLELIASTLTISGAVSLSANCSAYGAASTATGTPSSGVLVR